MLTKILWLGLLILDSILQPHQNSLILHAFMDLFCSFVRVNLFSEKVSQLSILFVYLIFYTFQASLIVLKLVTFECFFLILCVYYDINACFLFFFPPVTMTCNRCQGKWCFKYITFCMQCQVMTEIVTFIIGKGHFWFFDLSWCC